MGMFKLVARPCSVCKYSAHRKNMLFTGHVLSPLVISLSLGITFLSMAENNVAMWPKHENLLLLRAHGFPPRTRTSKAKGSRPSPVRLCSPSVNSDWNSGDCTFIVNRCRCRRSSPARPPLSHQGCRHLSICDTNAGARKDGIYKWREMGGGGGTLQFYLSTETIVSRVDGNLKAPVGEAGPRDLPERGPGSRRSAHCPRPSQGRAAGHSGSESQGHRASQVPASLAPRPA